MSAADAGSRLAEHTLLGAALSVLMVGAVATSGHADQAVTSPSGSDSVVWDGERDATIDELTQHAREIGDLLDGAGERVEDILADVKGDPEAEALAAAVHQELILSRQWNGHLTTVLLEVAEARRALEIREQKAADEIFALTTVAEEARRELIALWKVLKSEEQSALSPPERLPASRPDNLSDEQAAADTTIEEVQETLDRMGDMQTEAAGDIDAVRSKIIDALHTLAPHRDMPLKVDMPDEMDVEGSLSSRDITSWAASISSKLHHEGFDDLERAKAAAEARLAAMPAIEAMAMIGEALATTAIRIAPDHEATAIATVIAGSPVSVTGKVVDLDWYRVDIGDGRYGYVAVTLIRRQSGDSTSAKRLNS